MTKAGQQLLSPEAGWKRIDDTDPNLTFEGSWTRRTGAYQTYKMTDIYTSTIGNTLTFYMKSKNIRIISLTNVDLAQKVQIAIDDEIYSFSQYSSPLASQIVCFEKTGLTKGAYKITITATEAKYLSIDAIDIDEDGYISKDPIYSDGMALKNPLTNQNYSLADKTLIALTNTSDNNMILYGIKPGKEIQLDEAFDKMHYASDASVVDATDNSKVFTQRLEKTPNKLGIKEVKVWQQ